MRRRLVQSFTGAVQAFAQLQPLLFHQVRVYSTWKRDWKSHVPGCIFHLIRSIFQSNWRSNHLREHVLTNLW
jgi:hypothetical protein